MSDSIRENRTWEDVVQEIRMIFAEDIDRKCCIALVEGQDDCRFVKKVFLENVIAIESSSGKSELEKILSDERVKCSRLISIRDRDYMNIDDLPEQMFVYDHCCLEVMLFANDTVRKDYYNAYYIGRKSVDEYVVNIFRELAPYSVLRKHNEEECGSIKFKDKIAYCFNDDEKMEWDEIFRIIGQTPEMLLACCEEAGQLTTDSLWDITNGHDFYHLLALKTKVGGKLTNETGVRDLILGMYRTEDFKTTNLYNDLCTYQNLYGIEYVDI